MTVTATQYQNHTIEVTEAFQFKITGPLFDPAAVSRVSSEYESFADAKAAIDNRRAAAAKQKRVAETLALVVVNGVGESCVIKGIHMGTGGLLGVGEGDAYPATPKVTALLKERAVLNRRLSAIDQVLRRVVIKHNRAYGRVKAESYDGLIDRLINDHGEATAKATQEIRDDA